LQYEIKTVGGHRVLYVMATEAEYGQELRARFTPLICQVGPVEAAMHTTAALETDTVDLVVSLGSAGSQVLEQAKVYQVSSVSYRDMDASAFGFEKGVTPFLDLPAAVELETLIPGLPSASLSTGANVISGTAYATVAADMVDMETWAVMRAAHNRNAHVVGLRGISDGAQPVSEYADWTRYLNVIDRKLGEAVDALETALTTRNLKT